MKNKNNYATAFLSKQYPLPPMSKEIPTGWFIVHNGSRHTYLRLAISSRNYERASVKTLRCKSGATWTVGRRIG